MPAALTAHYYETHRRAKARCRHPSGEFTPFLREEIEQSIPARFAKIVAQYGDRLAVKDGPLSLTYAELNEAANRVAHTLLDLRGPQPEPIALLFDHGADMIVALLGILKAGKFYVPLHPLDPLVRWQQILEDTQPPLLLTDRRNRQNGDRLIDGNRILIESDGIPASAPSTDPEIDITPDAYAYILFTSGSTGVPKGVVGVHRNLLRFTMVLTNECGICAADRSALVQPIAFSGSLTPLYLALLNGAATLPFDVRRHGVVRLLAWLSEEEVTMLVAGSVYRAMCPHLDGSHAFPHLRLLYSGGGPTYRQHLEAYRRAFANDCIYVNSLSTTEVSGLCRMFIDKDADLEEEVAPIGYTDDDVELLLWDEDGRPVPAGEAGEIVVRTRYMGPGYWHRPDLTREKFVPDPDYPGQRLYKTGDLGRMLPDGCLIHLGRKDFQVKVRGFRVELGEVEGLLIRQPGVREAVVHPFTNRYGEQALAAYVVSDRPDLNVEPLRAALDSGLPDYMRPARYVFLDALPRLASTGKIDRKALPLPARMRPALAQAYVAPATPLEARLAHIWAEALDLDRVGVEDRFTDLGGDSLIAARLLAAVDEFAEKELPFSVLLEAATVREMARILEDGKRVPQWTSLVQVQPGDGRPPLFLVPAAASTSLSLAPLAAALGPQQPVYGFDPPGLDGHGAPIETVEAMAAHYVEEMRRLQPDGPYLLGGRCFGALVALEMAAQLQEAGANTALLVVVDGAPPPAGPTWSDEEEMPWHPGNRWAHLRLRLREKGPTRVVRHAVRRRFVKMKRQREVTGAVLAAHRAARRRYRGRQVNARIVAYLSEILADAESQRRWTELAGGCCEIVPLPEDVHNQALRAASLQTIVDHLRREIEGASPK